MLLLAVWVGVMMTRAFLPGPREETTCVLEPPVVGKVRAVQKLTGGSAQYEIGTDAGCKLLAALPRFPEYMVGDTLTVHGTIETVAAWEQRSRGYARYLARRGIAGTIYSGTVEHRKATARPGEVRASLIDRTHAAFREPEASALSAMMWGAPTRLPTTIEENFRRVGVTHILAISGFNLTVVAGAVWVMGWRLPLPAWVTVGLVTGLVWGYVALVGAPVSAVRAAWFWTLVVAGLRLRWLVSPLSVMLLAVAVMVTVDPTVIFDVGFQLSCAAVAGIWFAWFVSKPLTHRIPTILRAVLISTVGATLATAPIVAYHFGLISLTAIAANVVVVPATVVFMYAGFTGLFVHYIFPPLSLLISFGVHVIWTWMDLVTSYLAHVPALTLTDVSVPWAVLPAYYAVVLLGCVFWMRWQGRSWREVWA